MEIKDVHVLHESIARATLGISKAADRLQPYIEGNGIVRSVHRDIKGFILLMIDAGLDMGSILERADAEAPTPPVFPDRLEEQP